MTARRMVLLIGSVALGALLVLLLIRVGKIDLRETLRQLQGVSLAAFLKLVALNALLVLLSTAKWRKVDAALRHSSDSVPSRMTAYAFTSGGMALGLVLPVQLGMSAARTLGTYVHGRPLKRGTVGTLFEQGFDFLIVLFLGVASFATWYCKGKGAVWMVFALAMTALALLAAGPAIRLIRWLAASYGGSQPPRNRVLRRIWEMQHSGLLNAALARRLIVLSALRFGVVVLMAKETALAVHAHIALWQMAAAVPFVTLATVLAVTPGGIGVNELTASATLHLFGAPLAVAAQWSIANRVLATASCFAVAAGALAAQGIARLIRPNAAQAAPDPDAEES